MTLFQIADAAEHALATIDLSGVEQDISTLLHESLSALLPAEKTENVDLHALWAKLAALVGRLQQKLIETGKGVATTAPHPSSIKELLTEEFEKLEHVLATWRSDFTRDGASWTQWSEQELPKVLSLPQVQDLVSRASKGLNEAMTTLVKLLNDHPDTAFTVIPQAGAVATPSSEPVTVPETDAPVPEESTQEPAA